MSDKKQPVSITLSPSMTRQLDAIAENDGSNRSAVIRRAVLRLLENDKPTPSHVPALILKQAA